MSENQSPEQPNPPPPPEVLEPAHVAPRGVVLSGRAFSVVETVSHEGKVLLFGIDPSGAVHYSVRQSGFETSAGDGASHTPGFEDWKPLPLTASIKDPSVLAREAATLTTDPHVEDGEPRPAEQLARSVYGEDDPGTDPQGSLALVSGLEHLYVFRQSKIGTLLVNRFVLDGMTNELLPKLEVRFQRSRQRFTPKSTTRKNSGDPQDVDTLGFKDIEKNNFYEPAVELTFIKGLHRGRFAVVLTPTGDPDRSQWHIFHWDQQAGTLMLNSVRSSAEGLFDLRDHQILTKDLGKPGTNVYRTVSGIVTRAIALQGLQLCDRFGAVAFHRQVEVQSERGPQLCREGMQVMLALPVKNAQNQTSTAAICFAVGLDGQLSRIERTPRLEDLKAIHREVLLPLDDLDKIKALAASEPLASGAVSGLYHGDEDRLLVRTGAVPEHLKPGTRLELSQTRPYDGLHRVVNVEGDTFVIETPLQGQEPGVWVEVRENETGLVFDNMVTGYEHVGPHRIKVLCTSHDLNPGDEVQITGVGDYNGTYTIKESDVERSYFLLDAPWKPGEVMNIKSLKRRGLVFDGEGDYLLAEDVPRPAPHVKISFGRTISCWLSVAAVEGRSQYLVADRDGLAALRINTKNQVEGVVRLSSGEELTITDPVPLAADAKKWIHYTLVVEYRAEQRESRCLLYRDGHKVERLPENTPSYLCDGKSYFTGPGPGLAPGAPFTVEMWFQPTVISQDIYTGIFLARAAKKPPFQIELNGKGTLRLRYPDGTFVNVGKITTEWQHIAVCSAGQQLTVYLNGAVATAIDLPAPQAVGFEIVELGRGLTLDGASKPFRGGLAEVRVWDHSRTPDQIVNNLKLRADRSAPGLRALWPLTKNPPAPGLTRPLAFVGTPGWADTGPMLIDPSAKRPDVVVSLTPYHMERVVLSSKGIVVGAPFSVLSGEAPKTVEAWIFAALSRGPVVPVVSWSGPNPQDHFSLAIGPTGLLEVECLGKVWSGSTVLERMRWYHVSVSMGQTQGAPLMLFVNGSPEKVAAPILRVPVVVPEGKLRLGGNFRGNSPSFMLCDVRVWSRERTPEEIASSMYTRFTGIEADLVGLWPLEFGELHDSTSHRNHAVVEIGQPDWRLSDHVFPEPDYLDAWRCADGPLVLPAQDPADQPLLHNAINGVTIEMWCLPQDTKGNGLLILRGGDDSSFILELGADLTIQLQPLQGVMQGTGVQLTRGVWTHLALTIASDGDLKVYCNGLLQKHDRTVPSPRERTTVRLPWWSGKLTEVRLWNKVRSQAEIRDTLFVAMSRGRPNLMACWRCSPTELTDYSGRERHIPYAGPSRQTGAPTLVRATKEVDVVMSGKLGAIGLSDGFRGKLSDVRIWDLGLGEDEIRNQMCVALVGKPDGLAANWRLGGILEEGDLRFAPDFSLHDTRAIVHGDVFLGARSLPRRTVKGLEVVLFRNDDLLAVSPRGVYRETFEIRVDPTPDLTKLGAGMADLFEVKFWGRASRLAEEKITFAAEHSSIQPMEEKGWFRVESQLVVPDAVRLVRVFELAVRPYPGVTWESLEVRKHRLVNISDSITRERYVEDIALQSSGNTRTTGDQRFVAVANAEREAVSSLARIEELKDRLDALADTAILRSEVDTLNAKEVELTNLIAAKHQQIAAIYADVTQANFRVRDTYGAYWAFEGDYFVVRGLGEAQVFTCTAVGDTQFVLLADGKNCSPGPEVAGFHPRCKKGMSNWITVNQPRWSTWATVFAAGTFEAWPESGYLVADTRGHHAWAWELVSLRPGAQSTVDALKADITRIEADREKDRMRLAAILKKLAGKEDPVVLQAELAQLQEELPAKQAAYDVANAAFLEFVRAQQDTCLTMPELRRDAQGLSTLGLELTYANPGGAIHATESVEGEVHLSYVDTAGRVRLTRYDATADTRNAAFEQWVSDGFRACPEFAGTNPELVFARPIALPDDLWTVEVWFQYPLPVGAEGGYQMLVGRDGENSPLVVKQGRRLGSLIEGYFLDSGFDLGTLGPGWHHLALVNRRGASLFYLDGLPVAGELAGRTRDVVGLRGASDGVLVEKLTTFPSDRLTLDFWIKTTAATGCICSYGQQLRISDPGDLKVHLCAGVTLPAKIQINDGYWHHLALTWASDSGELHLIVDREDDHLVTQHATHQTLTPGKDLRLGQDQDGAGVPVPGQSLVCDLHAFSLWSRDLPRRDGHAVIVGDEAHLVGHWSMRVKEAVVTRTLENGEEEEDDVIQVVDGRKSEGHDGVLLGGAAWSLPPAFRGEITRAGYGAAGGASAGRLCELRVWNTALEAEEIQANSNVALTGYEPDLLHAYSMKEASGTVVRDHALNEPVHAALKDARWVACTAPIGLLSSHQALRTRAAIKVDRIQASFSAGISCECWLYLTAALPSDKTGVLFVQTHVDGTVPAFKVRLAGATGKLQVGFEDSVAGFRGVDSDVAIPAERWVHVAVTHDKKALRIYLDGRLAVSADGVVGPFSGRKSPWTLVDLAGTTFAVAELRVWGRARTLEELQRDRSCSLTGGEPDLVGYWDPHRTPYNGPRLLDLSPGRQAATVLGSVDRVGCSPLGGVHEVVTCEYATIGVDPRNIAAKKSLMRRFHAFLRGGAVNLWHGQRIEEMTLEWVGNTQFNPTLVGYIEGAPPVPSENLTEVDSYIGATSVQLSQSEDVSYSWSMSRDRSKGASLDFFAGAAWDVSAGIGIQKTLTQGRVGAKGSFSTVETSSRSSSVSAQSTVTKIDSLKLTGTMEETPRFPTIGPRFVPKNVGYAQVISGMADVFLVKLKRSGRMISYDIQPIPGVPLDVNTITFMINPAYQLNGSLDGTVGAMAADERFYGHVPEMRAQFGSLYPASYFRLKEAYALKEQIERMDAEREAYFQNFDASVAGISRVADGTAVAEPDAKAPGADGDTGAMGKDLSGQASKQKGALAGKGSSPEKEAATSAQLEAWQKRMEGLLTRAGKRNIVNTYVWDADGGLYAEQQSFASTIEHTIAGSFSMDWGAGLDMDVTVLNFNMMLTALYNGSMSQTLSKTESSSKGFSLNVDLGGVEGSGITDSRDVPLQPGVKVDRYRMMSFFLEGATRHFEEFFDYVVDPEWLMSNDEEARALRMAQKGRPNKTWRVMHRVTYVERPALLGFGSVTPQAPEGDRATNEILRYFDHLEARHDELKAQLSAVLKAVQK